MYHNVFFFKQKTADEMRISDWSSDVCSSDLAVAGAPRATMAPQWARKSSGVISFRSLLRHLGSSSRSKMDRRIARVLSAIGAPVSHFSPNSPKLFEIGRAHV